MSWRVQGHRTTLWSWFSRSTFTRILGNLIWLPGLCSKSLYQLNELPCLTLFLGRVVGGFGAHRLGWAGEPTGSSICLFLLSQRWEQVRNIKLGFYLGCWGSSSGLCDWVANIAKRAIAPVCGDTRKPEWPSICFFAIIFVVFLNLCHFINFTR